MNSGLRIAITADPYLPVPPTLYGGIERVLDFLVRGLADRGHQVTLFAHPDSLVPAALVPYGCPPHFTRLDRVRELWQVGARLWAKRNEFDLIHSFGRLAALTPVLTLRGLPKIAEPGTQCSTESTSESTPFNGKLRAMLLSYSWAAWSRSKALTTPSQ